jgi:hypothetical protein
VEDSKLPQHLVGLFLRVKRERHVDQKYGSAHIGTANVANVAPNHCFIFRYAVILCYMRVIRNLNRHIFKQGLCYMQSEFYWRKKVHDSLFQHIKCHPFLVENFDDAKSREDIFKIIIILAYRL